MAETPTLETIDHRKKNIVAENEIVILIFRKTFEENKHD